MDKKVLTQEELQKLKDFQSTRSQLVTDFGIIEFQEKLVLLNNHLETIYQLETFYGEPVIQNLIKHLKVTVADIKAFKDSFIVSEGKEEESVDEKNAE